MSPFKPAKFAKPTIADVERLRQICDELGMDFERDVRPRISNPSGEAFINDTYEVVREQEGLFYHISLRRIDGGRRDSWEDFQNIKAELVGPEHEGVELLPAANRTVLTPAQRHLWVATDPAYRFPFGFDVGPFSIERTP